MIGRIAKYLPGKILKQITQALIESSVNYCSVVWGNAPASEIRRLQIAQNKAALDWALSPEALDWALSPEALNWGSSQAAWCVGPALVVPGW